MTTQMILFPGDVRLSTWVAVAAFVTLTAVRRDRWPLLAGVAWITGFEAIFQSTSLVAYLVAGRTLPLGPDGPVFYVVLGLVAVPAVTRHGARPSWWLLGLAAAVWVAWIGTGFHVNEHTMVGFSASGEAFNEAAKMLWAAAYLVPVWPRAAPGPVSARPLPVNRSYVVSRLALRSRQPAAAGVRISSDVRRGSPGVGLPLAQACAVPRSGDDGEGRRRVRAV